MRPFLRYEPPPPPVIAELPPWELTATDGRSFGSADLAGRVWVANFFFTRCMSICPQLTAAMARLERRYRDSSIDDVHLVSITVDPEHDTPARLRAYAERHAIDAERWTLLTGRPEAVEQLVVRGFLKPMGDAQVVDGDLIDIAHTGELALVDGDGGIRGYYGSDALGLDEIFHRSQHVLKESR